MVQICTACLFVQHTHMKEAVSATHRLVAKQDVDVGHDLHQVLLEELADERRREVHAEHLVVIRHMLGHLEDRLRGHRQEETLKQQTRTR